MVSTIHNTHCKYKSTTQYITTQYYPCISKGGGRGEEANIGKVILPQEYLPLNLHHYLICTN